MQCALVARQVAGDHVIYLGGPTTISVAERSPLPLIFWRGAYHALSLDHVVPIDWSEEYMTVSGLP